MVKKNMIEEPICPNCKSENVVIDKKTGYATLVSIFLLGLPLPVFKKEYYCFECESRWSLSKRK